MPLRFIKLARSRKRSVGIPVAGALALACVSALSHAQIDPRDAGRTGEIIRDDQRQRLTPAPATAPSLDIAPKRAVKPIAGVKVNVTGFRFSGLTVVSEERVQPLIQKFIGPDRTFEDLQGAADAVSEYLQQQGYFVAQAYLPEQRIEDGVIELAVLEGRLANVRVDRDPGVPVSQGIIEGLLSPLAPGTVMHRDVVERALFLVSDLRGLSVRSIVEPGPTPGTSNLVVKVSAGRRVDGLIEFDNHGSRFTGEHRLGGGINFNSPFGRGDLLSFRGLLGVPGGGKDLDFGRISYLSPVGNFGTKLGVAYLRLNFHLGTSSFEALNQSGRSEVISVFGLHPVIRTRNLNLFAQASFDAREFEDNRQAVSIVSNRKTKLGTISLVGDSRDTFVGGGINNFSLGYTAGRLEIENPNELAADQSALGLRTAGRYSRFNGSITRLNSITQNVVAFVSYSFQRADQNLDASEKLGLGGPNGVRAYAVGEATSDESQFFTAEIRAGIPQITFLPGNVAASVFYDIASGKLNKNPPPNPLNPDNTRTLQGAGFGLTWARQDDFLVRASLAWRLSGHPLSDPADRKPRLYFQLQKFL